MGARFLIVDGHSIIFAWPDLLKLHRRRNVLAREELIKILREYQDSTGIRAVLVFDGQGSKVEETTEPEGIQVFYSGKGQTADQVIERLVAKYSQEHDLTVATSDLMEQQTVISLGALCISAEGLKRILGEAQEDFSKEIKTYRRKMGLD